MNPTIREILARPAGAEAKATGWVRTRRSGKTASFLEISDGSTQATLQVVLPPDAPGLPACQTGAAVRASGLLVSTPGAKQAVELHAADVEIVGRCDAEDYPLQKKRHTLEFLREIAHLRPRTNTLGAVARLRSGLSQAVHSFFAARGFHWIHTPIITGSDAEGAGQMFRVTTLPLENPPRRPDGSIDWERDFFGHGSYLTVSGQLAVEAYALALGRVYTFGPTFRAENSHTARHLAEFWMIEPEMAFADLEDDAALAEDFIRHLLRTALDGHGAELAFFEQHYAPGLVASLEAVAGAPRFERLTYTEAVARLESSGRAFEYPVRWGIDLQSEHERWLTEELVHGPVVVTDYPKDIKAFYMKANEDDRTVRAMDILVPKVGEIIGGSQREDDAARLEARIAELGMDAEHYRWYLDLRRFGGAPHAGFGLGLERLLLWVTGLGNVRDVIPYPRTPGTAEF